MKKKILSLFVVMALCLPQIVQAKVIHLLPKPKMVQVAGGGAFALGRNVTITDPTGCVLLQNFFTDNSCQVVANGGASVTVRIVEGIEGAYDYELAGYENEAYSLEITADAINIAAVTKTGVIRAAQTLAQLAEGYEGTPELEALTLTDWPAFKLRGYMHDVGRSFVEIETLKRHIDLLSRFKVNTFHWHMTENQAWRFEVKAYPQLTYSENMTRFPGKYYTQEQCKELQDYALERGVIVVPEIDMPGHSEAFVRAMNFDMQSTQGIEALKVILGEVAAVFDKVPYIHIGADEKATTESFLKTMTQRVHDLNKKTVVWNPINNIAVSTSIGADMCQMWSTNGKAVDGMPAIDCRYNYTNHFDIFADLVGIYKSNIYYEQKGNANVAGTISAPWNDRKTPTENDIIIQNNFFANAIASAERAWMGGGKRYIDNCNNGGINGGGGTTLPNSGEEYDEFADWERRFLFHKANSLKDEPIAYVKQTNVRWKITEPFPNGGNMSATFAPETDGLNATAEMKDSYVHNGITYGTGMATGAGIYLRHTWGNNTIQTYYGATNHSNVTSYAWTYVYSETEQTVGAQIEFQNYGRSERDKAPDAGKWDRKGSDIWLNGERIAPPAWDNTGKDIYWGRTSDFEIELMNENFAARNPIPVKLKAGWNKVFIKLPYVTADGVRLNKWMFTFVLTDLDGKNAVEGLIYSPAKSKNLSFDQIVAAIGEAKNYVENTTGDKIGLYSPALAKELNDVIAAIEATLSDDISDEERATQLKQLNAAFEAFKVSLENATINKPKLSTNDVSYYYTLCTPNRDKRYAASNGAGAEMTGHATVTDAAKWKFVLRADGKYDIVNCANGTYVSPSSSYNTSLRTQTSSPSAGWELKQASTQGMFIIVSGTDAQFNQTNSGLGYKIYNWGSGTNTTDDGCQYLIEESDVDGEIEPPVYDDVCDVQILVSKGEFTLSNDNRTWFSRWESNEVKGFSFAATANNMQASGDNIAGYSGLSLSSTYTITAPEGYMITNVAFGYVNTSNEAYSLNLSVGGNNYTTSSTLQKLNVEVSQPERTFTFTQSGANKGITFSDFIVTIAKDPRAPEIAYEIFTTKTSSDIPYRIPAITMAKNGDIIAVADYRHSGNDIGMTVNGRIDLHARISNDNGKSWGEVLHIVEGRGVDGINTPGQMYVAFGDPCIVTDRESGKILVISCSGNVSFPAGTRYNHQGIAHFYSTDNGLTWSEPVDRSESIYSQFDNSSHGPVHAMFIGSGKIHQSRYVKVGNYYRIYCAALVENKNNVNTNFVFYSDDFGVTWNVLGGVDIAPVPSGADEPKVEELPNGNIIISSRMHGGRFYNIFTFTNPEAAEGSWGACATSNASVNGVVALDNSCNGEIMIVPVVRKSDNKEMWLALQSLPFGSGRSNVGIYYKELESGIDYNTPANFAKDWNGRHQASVLSSAYSTMCYQKDSTIAFLYEEDTYGIKTNMGYNIMYKNYSIEQITNGAYSILKGREPELQPDLPSDATKAMILEAKEILKLSGVGYPTDAPRAVLEAEIKLAESNPTESAGVKLGTAIDNYLNTTEVALPEGGKKYTLTMVAKNGNRFYLNYTGSDIAIVARGEEELPETAQFLCADNGDGTVSLTTNDGRYLVYHTKYQGVDWLQNSGDTDGLQDAESDMTKITFSKMQNGGSVSADNNKLIFGLLSWYGIRGVRNDNGANEYGYVVLKTDGKDYDGASAPFWNENFSSGFMVEEVGGTTTCIKKIEASVVAEGIYDIYGRKLESITAPGLYIVDGRKVLVK